MPTHSFATLRMLLHDDPRAFRPTALTDVRIGFSLQAQKKSNEDYCLMLCRLVQRCGSGAKQSTNLTRQRHLCQCGGRSRFSTWSDGQRLRPPESGSTLKAAVGTSLVAYLGYKGYRLLSSRWDRVEDVELPAVPEPSGHFVHPYEIWPWYQKAWFAFKRSVASLDGCLLAESVSIPATCLGLLSLGVRSVHVSHSRIRADRFRHIPSGGTVD